VTGPDRSGGGAPPHYPVNGNDPPYDLREPIRSRELPPSPLRRHHETTARRKGGLPDPTSPVFPVGRERWRTRSRRVRRPDVFERSAGKWWNAGSLSRSFSSFSNVDGSASATSAEAMSPFDGLMGGGVAEPLARDGRGGSATVLDGGGRVTGPRPRVRSTAVKRLSRVGDGGLHVQDHGKRTRRSDDVHAENAPSSNFHRFRDTAVAIVSNDGHPISDPICENGRNGMSAPEKRRSLIARPRGRDRERRTTRNDRRLPDRGRRTDEVIARSGRRRDSNRDPRARPDGIPSPLPPG